MDRPRMVCQQGNVGSVQGGDKWTRSGTGACPVYCCVR